MAGVVTAKRDLNTARGRMTTTAPKRDLAVARTRLQSASAAILGNPTPAQVRKAREMAAGAVDSIDAHIAALVAADAEGHRAMARRLAKGRKDVCGYKRPPQTMPGYNKGRVPASKGVKYEIHLVSVSEVTRMLALAPTMWKVYEKVCPYIDCGATWREPHGQVCVHAQSERFKFATTLMWRGGFRVGCELVKLRWEDLNPAAGTVYVRKGKYDKPRHVTLDDWVWPMLQPWLDIRADLPDGPLLCALEGPRAGIAEWDPRSIRQQLHRAGQLAQIPHRLHPHAFRHTMAIEMKLEGIDELIISRQMGHSSLAVTSNYFKGLPQSVITQHLRSRPMPRVALSDVLGMGHQSAPRADPTFGGLRPMPQITAPDLMGVLANA